MWPVDENESRASSPGSSSSPRLNASSSSETRNRKIRHYRQYSSSERSSTVSDEISAAKNRRSVHFAVTKPLPQAPLEEEVDRLSLRDEPPSATRNNHGLHIEIPSNDNDRSSLSPCTPRQNSATSASPVSATQEPEIEEETWGERPSIEKLYRDIDKYLPGHDLDKEIFIEAPQGGNAATPSPSSRRLQGHKKSIRVVAKEAHRNWRQAMNVIRVNHLLRRRSTKMWGRKVEQVKPGMIVEGQTIAKEPQASGFNGDKPGKQNLQRLLVSFI